MWSVVESKHFCFLVTPILSTFSISQTTLISSFCTRFETVDMVIGTKLAALMTMRTRVNKECRQQTILLLIRK